MIYVEGMKALNKFSSEAGTWITYHKFWFPMFCLHPFNNAASSYLALRQDVHYVPLFSKDVAYPGRYNKVDYSSYVLP